MALLGNLTGSAPFFNSNRFYNGVATQSLRFNDDDSAYLSRTPSSASNRKTWTWSGWVKRGNLGSFMYPFSASEATNTDQMVFGYTSSDTIRFFANVDSTNVATTAVYRDTSSWYHITLVLDTTQATSSNRIKVYVNGEQASLSGTFPAINRDLPVNSTARNHSLGSRQPSSDSFFDGYLSEVNFIDGTALDPTSFGEFKNGVWIAKRYTGSYGTNGFRLQFNQTGTGTASSSTIGADTSGNDNHFSSSGIVASDCDMPDSPENNFPTWNPIAPHPTYGITTISEGNLKSLNSPANNKYSEITFRLDQTNKYYFEYYNINATTGTNPASFELFASSSNKASFYIITSGYIYVDGSSIGSGFPTLSAGDIVNIAYDGASGKLWLGKNGTYYNASGSATGNPADGTNPIATLTSAEFKMTSTFYQQGAIMNFGQDSTFAGGTTAGGNTDDNGIGDFKYSVPSGYLALCASNLPEPTISPNADEQADDYFNTVLYTGNGSTQSITGVGFQPDWVWIKQRNQVENHFITDVIRGAGIHLRSDQESAENDDSATFTSFDSDGFSLTGTGPAEPQINDANDTYVSWNWKARGTAVSNTDGTITSSVSANTDAGFSIVSYSGNGVSGATLGHGLSQAPNFAICKRRNSISNWRVGTDATGTLLDGYFNLTLSMAADSTTYQAFNSSTITLGNSADVNTTGGIGGSYVMYVFHDVEGYSKFGSYTGNGSADGTFVYTGFRPAFVITKPTTVTGDWHVTDSARTTFNNSTQILYPNLSNAEYSNVPQSYVDYLSNGFKIRDSGSYVNQSGQTYIYMAFAENPFKYANAR